MQKYCTSSTAEIVLDRGKLRWSHPREFNDKLEMKHNMKFEPSISESYDDWCLEFGPSFLRN